MNSEKICNTKKEVPTGISLNEKDYITELLTTLKDMVKNYTIAMAEASNESLYQKYLNSFNKLMELQRETFETMFRKGWYCLETAPKDKIKEKGKTLETEYRDLYL